MSEGVTPVAARVARVIDPFKFVINRGSEHGVAMGQRFIIFEKGEEIVDPATGDSLGALELVKAHGEVIHVQEKMAIIQAEVPKRERTKTLSEIMASISGVDEDQHALVEVKVGDHAKPEPPRVEVET